MMCFRKFPRLIILFGSLVFAFQGDSFGYDEHAQKIFKQEQLLKEGSVLVEKGFYAGAIKKYKEALDPSVLNTESDKGNAVYYIEKVYKLQARYEEALKELQWYVNRNPDPKDAGWLDEKLELDALIKTRDGGNAQPIYKHIDYLKKKYKDVLPPKKVMAGISDIKASAIFRLYDHIADYDAGMAFAEDFLKFYAKIGPGNPYQPANPHFQIKKAFEQDKRDGRPGCITAKPGQVCMGRATKALIQSDYFPW